MIRVFAPLAVLLISCGGVEQDRPAGAESTRPAPSAPSHEVFSLDALDAVLRDGKLVVVDPGAVAARALELSTGRELWRVELGDSASVAVIHDLSPGRLLVQVPGQHFHAIDLERGELVGRYPSPHAWRFVRRNRETCALTAECELSPMSCADGAPIGPELVGATVSWASIDPDGDHSATCASPVEVLGGAGELSLFVFHEQNRPGPEVIAIDRSGEVRWRTADAACSVCVHHGMGQSPDERVCWTTDVAEGTRDLQVFRCADGEALFSRQFTFSGGVGRRLTTGWVPEPAGILVATPDEVVLLDSSGSQLWARPTQPGVLVVPTGLRLTRAQETLEYPRIQRVDPTTGARIETEAARAGWEWQVDRDGGIIEARTPRERDRNGARVAPLEVFDFRRSRGRSMVRHGGEVLLSLSSEGHVIGEHTDSSGTWLAVSDLRRGTPDRVHVLAAD